MVETTDSSCRRGGHSNKHIRTHRGWRRDDFEVHSLLGEGAFSRVYLATIIETGEQVAIKVIQKQKVLRNSILKAILNEKKVLSSLDKHPNFIKLICTFQDDIYLYFVLDLIPGGSLNDCLQRYGKAISQELPFYWVCDIINILSYLRMKQIAHRDIKPDNLLLDEYRRLRLIDFNNCIILTHDNDKTSDHISSTEYIHPSCELFGSLPYLPPEIIMHITPKLYQNDAFFNELYSQWLIKFTQPDLCMTTSEVSYSTDIWSSGCVVFELLCGYHPFRGKSDIETIFNILEYRLIIPNNRLTPPEADLLCKMLAFVPNQRLGVQNILDLQQHPLFSSVTLTNILQCNERPPYELHPITTTHNQISIKEEDDDVFEFTPDMGCSFRRIVTSQEDTTLEYI